MKESRRDFIKKLALSGLITSNFYNRMIASESLGPLEKVNNEAALTVLFQGDSITDGNRSRYNDWNHVLGHGYVFLIASRLWYKYPDKKIMFYNRGVSGDRIRDLNLRWQKDTLDIKPDVLSILVGVNDVISVLNDNHPDPPEKFEIIFDELLDRTMEKLPQTKIVLCEPFSLPVGHIKENETIWQRELKIRQLITRNLAEKYKAIFVELQESFENACRKAPAEFWIWDGVHPMPAGHELIARKWIKQVKKKLTDF